MPASTHHAPDPQAACVAARPASETLLRAGLCALFAFAVIKAASADMTWDEAWTYLFYGRSWRGFLALDYANDHPLNSLLVWGSTRLFGNSELIIRLPNLAAFALYLTATARMLAAVRVKVLAGALCLLNPYLFDYFALARGYGLSTALVQAALVAGLFGAVQRLRAMLLGAFLATLSIFSTVLVFYALLAACVLVPALRSARAWTGLRNGPLRPGWVVLFAALGAIPCAGLLWVAREGQPVYASADNYFNAVVRGIAAMYVAPAWSALAAIAALLVIAVLLAAATRHLRERSAMLLAAAAMCFAAIFLAGQVMAKPLPTGRVLLPFLPLLNLALISAADDLVRGGPALARRAAAAAGSLLATALLALFLGRLHFQRYADWPEDYRLQARTVRALASRGCFPADVAARFGHVYYLDRWFPPGARPADTPCGP